MGGIAPHVLDLMIGGSHTYATDNYSFISAMPMYITTPSSGEYREGVVGGTHLCEFL